MSPSEDEPRPDLPTGSNPHAIVDLLLSEAETRRQQESEKRRLAEEHARWLDEQKALRDRLEQALERAYRFPGEEREQGRKPCLDGFQRWAGMFVELGDRKSV